MRDGSPGFPRIAGRRVRLLEGRDVRLLTGAQSATMSVEAPGAWSAEVPRPLHGSQGEMARIRLEEGDITDADVDAVVNAANTALRLGAGVAGAIRSKGGPAIQAECDRLGPIGLGEAAMTGGGELRAKHVIHAAGMHPGGGVSEESLRACVRSSLDLAREHALRSVALPAIGTGVGGFSVQRCAEVMLEETERHLAGQTSLEEVRFVLFGEPAYRIFEQVHDAARIRQVAKPGR